MVSCAHPAALAVTLLFFSEHLALTNTKCVPNHVIKENVGDHIPNVEKK